MRHFFFFFFFSFFCSVNLIALQEKREAGVDVVVLPQSAVIDGDYFTWGKNIEILGTIKGDLYVLGGQVLIDGTIDGDVLVAGGSVKVLGKVSQDIRILGGQVRIGGEVGKNVTALSGTMELLPSAHIGQNVTVLSGNVDLNGYVENHVRVYASNVGISDRIGGNVKAHVGQMHIFAGANIGGSVEYWSSRDVLVDSRVSIGKGIIQHPSFFYGKLFKSLRIGSKFAALVMNFFYTLVVGLILIRYFPTKVKRAIIALEKKPFQALVAGIVLLILLPLVFLVLLITILGMPFALTLLAVNVISLYTAKIFPLLWVTKHLFSPFAFRKHMRLNFTLVLFVYFFLTLIPFLGEVLSLGALFFGLGAIVLEETGRYSVRE